MYIRCRVIGAVFLHAGHDCPPRIRAQEAVCALDVMKPTSSQEMQKVVTQAETTVSAHERSYSM